jgi:hypothetical protein
MSASHSSPRPLLTRSEWVLIALVAVVLIAVLVFLRE